MDGQHGRDDFPIDVWGRLWSKGKSPPKTHNFCYCCKDDCSPIFLEMVIYSLLSLSLSLSFCLHVSGWLVAHGNELEQFQKVPLL